jgi:hypothetical protein
VLGPVLAWACITNTWKEVPTGFFSEKMSDAFFRIAPLGKVTFSRGGGGMGPPRSA